MFGGGDRIGNLAVTVAVLLMVGASCGQGNETTIGTKPLGSIDIEPPSEITTPGATVQFVATVRDAAGNSMPDAPIAWSSSNPAVATVSTLGIVTGVQLGTATVIAASQGASREVTIEVRAAAPRSDNAMTPLIDMGGTRYLGFAGGLYPGGNAQPPGHMAEGIRRANSLTPRDAAGQPSLSGKILLLSIGMSNATQEWCSEPSTVPCEPWTFTGQALADPVVNKEQLVIVNGALAGQTYEEWSDPANSNWNRIRNTVLVPLGYTERQVAVVWLKDGSRSPTVSLPSQSADAYTVMSQIGKIARIVKVRYPNMEILVLSGRTYGGYASTSLNPEPFAYETGLAVKWVVEAQIRQIQGSGIESHAVDLDYNTVAPWIGWSAYLWANGASPRSDGLQWLPSDVENDGIHPSQTGETKVGLLLLDFFKTGFFTKCWFVAGGTCP